ncbi:tryptophan synthase subunit alpha [Rubrobacter indicoceani]|uniref:tryptophan synthase subunit alpha n=1 Tax=Rubrobacter indicoceani TaxID=2051957 RepID=UPI000E5BD6EB|nr:tryptophan synthase subunit alpha [Rubrobacter indicoceani]
MSNARGSNVSRLVGAFEGKTALIPYLTGGYPSLDGAREVGEAYIEAGGDIVEIGVPFSDPLADGPVIQGTTVQAIRNGANTDYCLDLAGGFACRVPVVFLVYYNTVMARGTETFLSDCAENGVTGLVIPDLPVEEAREFSALAAEADVGLCPLAAPTTSERRLEGIGAAATGFVYCVSVAGVTGVREKLPPQAVEILRRVKAKVSAPTALGFGIGSASVARQAAREADGVIIGTKLMQIVEKGGAEAAGAWLSEISDALPGVEHH